MSAVPIVHEEWQAAAERDGYWRGRWPYLSRAIALVGDVEPHRLLEVGPWTLPLFYGSRRMDWNRAVLAIGDQCWDARKTPWPFADDAFDVALALQVFEHLGPDFATPFREAMRVGRRLVVSLPYRWGTGGLHAGIDETTLRRWFGREPVCWEVVREGDAPRLLAVYDREEV